jgi:hypothetical protein
MGIKTQAVGGTVCGAALICASAQAAPVVYDWTGGSLTVLAVNNNNGNTLGQGSIPLTAPSQVTFDPGPPVAVPSFEFADPGPSGVTLTGGTLAGDTLTVSNLVVIPATGYTSSGTGSNPYNVTLDNLWASGSFSVTNGSNTIASGTFNHTLTATLTGQVTLTGSGSSEALALNGIALDGVTINGAPVTIKADVIFDGSPVPLPAAFWMLGSGLVGFAGMARGRRRAAR